MHAANPATCAACSRAHDPVCGLPHRRGATCCDHHALDPSAHQAALQYLPQHHDIQRRAFHHMGIAPGSCTTCHNGTMSKGKPAGHIATTAPCDSCHKTSAWTSAKFSHVSVAAGSCASCHNGASAKGKPSGHIPTGAACDSCHKTSAWTRRALATRGLRREPALPVITGPVPKANRRRMSRLPAPATAAIKRQPGCLLLSVTPV